MTYFTHKDLIAVSTDSFVTKQTFDLLDSLMASEKMVVEHWLKNLGKILKDKYNDIEMILNISKLNIAFFEIIELNFIDADYATINLWIKSINFHNQIK